MKHRQKELKSFIQRQAETKNTQKEVEFKKELEAQAKSQALLDN